MSTFDKVNDKGHCHISSLSLLLAAVVQRYLQRVLNPPEFKYSKEAPSRDSKHEHVVHKYRNRWVSAVALKPDNISEGRRSHAETTFDWLF